MQKILVIGIVASGKSTLSRELHSILQYPLYELDQVAHNSGVKGRPKRTPEEQMNFISDINDTHNNWIFEGVYREAQKDVYELADTIVYMNLPLWLRQIRIITRFIKQQLHLESCHYRSDLRMLKFMFKWTKDFEKKRDDYEAFLAGYNTKLIELKSKKEVKRFIKKLRSLRSLGDNNEVTDDGI